LDACFEGNLVTVIQSTSNEELTVALERLIKEAIQTRNELDVLQKNFNLAMELLERIEEFHKKNPGVLTFIN
jgi:hypothetical protein